MLLSPTRQVDEKALLEDLHEQAAAENAFLTRVTSRALSVMNELHLRALAILQMFRIWTFKSSDRVFSSVDLCSY
jgi:hypothetical protein